ncbi:MAG: hypothetical protein CMH30_03770 [Micavibrio sp.]|nr:hypothetical protein [Micavibrio sp.]|tara:strand:+ start:301 stop:732 length:432 start_codon:yes stop_codon:yes gene_type:complete
MSYISITAHPAIELPLPPQNKSQFEMDVYARFFRHLRCVPNSRAEIKILSSLQFTADMMGASDEHITKVLVECGLRAPRSAFPQSFLAHIDQALVKDDHEYGAATPEMKDLAAHWHSHGEDSFAMHRYIKPLANQNHDMFERV